MKVDDGFTGSNFERPAVKELLKQVKQGGIHCILVKDMRSPSGRTSGGWRKRRSGWRTSTTRPSVLRTGLRPATIVNEFIKQIIVYAPDKSSGKRTQKVEIVFHFLEEVEVPEISEPVIIETPMAAERRRDIRSRRLSAANSYLSLLSLAAPEFLW